MHVRMYASAKYACIYKNIQVYLHTHIHAHTKHMQI